MILVDLIRKSDGEFFSIESEIEQIDCIDLIALFLY